MKNPPLTKNAHLDWNPKLDIPHYALAAAIPSAATTVTTQTEFAENNWVSALEDFGVGDARVGHVCVHTAGAVPGGAGAGASGDGFVVAEAFGDGGVGGGRGRGRGGGGGGVAAEAEGEVVAVALGGGAGSEAMEDYVRYALAL